MTGLNSPKGYMSTIFKCTTDISKIYLKNTVKTSWILLNRRFWTPQKYHCWGSSKAAGNSKACAPLIATNHSNKTSARPRKPNVAIHFCFQSPQYFLLSTLS